MTIRDGVIKGIAAAVLAVFGWVGNSAWVYVTTSLTTLQAGASQQSERLGRVEGQHSVLFEWLARIEDKIDRLNSKGVEKSTPR